MIILTVEIAAILLLLVLNGVLAMAEMALVASRRPKLRQLAAAGDDGARVALGLATSPNRFLSTVQTGITLVGLLAGALGGVTIASQFTEVLRRIPLLSGQADVIGVGLVVLVLTFLSLIIGELVPKRLALANPEVIASRVAKPLEWLGRMLYPMNWLLSTATDLALRLLRAKTPKTDPVYADEMRQLLQDGLRAGVFHHTEPRMVESVLSFDQLPVRKIMTPGVRLMYLNKADSHEAIWHKIVVSGHSHFPVYEGSRDNVVGMLSVKSIYANLAAGAPARTADLMTRPLQISAEQTVTQLLESFRKAGQHVALVVGTGGEVIGLVTMVDVLEAIVGEIPTAEERMKPSAIQRPDGSWLVDGRHDVGKLTRLLAMRDFPGRDDTAEATLAALVATQLGGRIAEGATVETRGLRCEVIDLEGDRIRTLLVTKLPSP